MENQTPAQRKIALYAYAYVYKNLVNATAEVRKKIIENLQKGLAANGVKVYKVQIKQGINAVHKWHQLNSMGLATPERLAENGVDSETASICADVAADSTPA